MFDGLGMALCWLVLVGFVRLSTKRGILPSPLTVAQTLSVVDDWLAHPRACVLEPGPQHAGILWRLLLESGTGTSFLMQLMFQVVLRLTARRT